MQQASSGYFQLEEMVQMLITIVGHSNSKLKELENRIKELEQELEKTKMISVK